ncbi:MAG: hypothetical protein J0H38_01835 [Rhizobiales bacterium]|nr:hypothetical protein [Hyphomicrobiales bacterium]
MTTSAVISHILASHRGTVAISREKPVALNVAANAVSSSIEIARRMARSRMGTSRPENRA